MEISIQKKLTDLWKLQEIDTRLDKLRSLLGELPMEVADLEDSIVGLETRVKHIEEEIAGVEGEISDKRNSIKDFKKRKSVNLESCLTSKKNCSTKLQKISKTAAKTLISSRANYLKSKKKTKRKLRSILPIAKKQRLLWMSV